jgi:hypothetical protein
MRAATFLENVTRQESFTVKRLSGLPILVLFVTVLVTACGSSGGDGSGTTLSSAKTITAFSFTSPAATGVVNENAKTIALTVPYGTNVTALVATFTTTGVNVKVGSSVQVSGTTPNDFTNPVLYVVTAADSSTATYAVTVIVAPISAQWARTVTVGNNASYSYSVSVASDGSVYAAGFISGTGTYNFGNNVTATGAYAGGNIVLVKYNSSGVAQWAQTVTAGNNASSFNSVAVAPDGSVYAAGNISGTGTYNFGNNVTAAGTYSGDNIVLVKYNSSGVAQWAQTVTAGNGESSFNGVYVTWGVASDGSLYASGYISGTGTYNFGNSVSAAGTFSGKNIVLVKYNSSGVAQWAQTVTAGVYDSVFLSVSVASDGSVYAAGYISGTGTYNFGNSVTAAGPYSTYNCVLVKYNSSGVAQWAQTVTTGNYYSVFLGVSVASDGSVYAAGVIGGTGTYNFGNSVFATGKYSGENTVLVRYNSSGVAQWAQTVTAGTSDSVFYSVSVASDGSVYAAGVIGGTGTYNFGNSVTAAGPYSTYNCVLVRYNSSGEAQGAQTVTAGNSDSYFYGVSVASDGSVYAAGVIGGTGTYNFGNSVTATGTFSTYNMVLVKYN